ncbi:DUF2267 domain-containing protein [bacterium]|nr:DUF2267 domain-containing protein [bacterium]
MQAEEFLRKVQDRAGLPEDPNHGPARRATEAVFETLRARISHQGGDNVAAQLPKELKDMWESGLLEHIQRAISGFERMDLGVFVARVSEKTNIDDMQKVENVTRAVFATLQEQITPGAREAVSHQLPPDLREFWETALSTQVGPPYEMEAPVQESYISRQHAEEAAEPMAEEEVGARPWGPETDLPSGADVEMVTSGAEAQVRDIGEGTDVREPGEEPLTEEAGFEAEGVRTDIPEEAMGIRGEEPEAYELEEGAPEGEAVMSHVPGEEEVHPPSEERVTMTMPPDELEGRTGPASEHQYRLDPELTREIEEMLESSDEVDASNIDVFVQAGNVTLRGHVKTAHERDTAIHVASKALGIGEIRSELDVHE